MAIDLDSHRAAEDRLWAQHGVTPTERFVTLSTGGRMRVQELGEGPPFVLIHGGSISGTSWCKLAARLEGVRCIMVDRPGCGLSDPIGNAPLKELDELKAYADGLLEQVLDALELDQAAVGCTSYGGFLAFRGAAKIPERVTKLVEYSWLIGAPCASVPFLARLGALPGMQELAAKLPMSRGAVKFALKQVGLKKAFESGVFDDVALDWAHSLLSQTNTMANELASIPKVFTPIKGQNDEILHSDELLAKLTMPVLFLWGENDPNGGADIGRAFAPRLPNAELVIVPGAEHAPWLDDLDRCVERTQQFLLS